MTRWRLALAVVVVVVVALGAAASLSYNRSRTFALVDAAAAPIDRAYVLYQYRGSRPNFVDSISYEASPLTLVRSDRDGRVVVPGAWHLHAPFPIKTHPSRWIELVYVPRLHNAWGHLNESSPSLNGVFVIEQPGRRATVFDLGDRPELWEGTLRNLASSIGRLTARPVGPNPRPAIDGATAALTRELIGDLRQELMAFIARYGAVPRELPEMPSYLRSGGAEDQKRWAEAVATQLRQEPTWGSLINHLFTDELTYYEQWAAGTR
jgi:hypothetical protein